MLSSRKAASQLLQTLRIAAHDSLGSCRGKKTKARLAVVLLQEVEGLGLAGKQVTVKQGYARNFLLPYKLAAPATARNVQLYASDAGTLAQQEAAATQARAASAPQLTEEDKWQRDAVAILDQLLQQPLVIKRQAAEGRALSAPVSAEDLSAELARQARISMVPGLFDLEQPLGELGEYDVPLRLVTADGRQPQLEVRVVPR